VSTNRTSDWTDNILAESQTPSDEFTWTEGSNYGLDGFSFDQTLGEGLRNRGDQSGMAGPITPAQTSGMSDLPDGFVSDSKKSDDGDLSFVDEDEGVFDLSAMLSHEEGGIHMMAAERQAASLADLAWLDPTQEQDPERLPKELRPDKPPLNSIPELEDAWGVDRRTTGLELVPNRDKPIADYEQSIESGIPATPGVEKNAVWHIKKAVRMSHFGSPMGEIGNYLLAALGDTPVCKKALATIASEHGVAGNIFVRASAFPGLRNGKWVKKLKKACRSARYVITDNPGIAAKLSMPMVKAIPYRKALRQYLPHLTAAGFKVAAVGNDAKKTLQLAFLTGPKEALHVPSTKPVHVQAHERVSAEDAREAFQKAPRPVQKVVAKDDTAKARKAALRVVAKACKAGLISTEEALKLGQSKASPASIRQAAEMLARVNLMPKQAAYSGLGTQVREHQQVVRDAAWTVGLQEQVNIGQWNKAAAHVVAMLDAGQLSEKEASKALHLADPKAMFKLATAYANSNSQRKVKLAATPAKEFDGPLIKQALQQRPKAKKLAADEQVMREASVASGIKVAEFRGMARWLRRKMSEGMAGKDLTAVYKIRFASPLRTASEGLVAMLREEHEGLAGHLYVDAAAYASKTGSKGCEAASSRHRSNQVPFVKAMPRCSSCTLASEGSCIKYGKELLHTLPKDASKFKAQMVHAADASDHEITASLFNPSEFSLRASLDVDLNEPALTENIDDVFFGDGITF